MINLIKILILECSAFFVGFMIAKIKYRIRLDPLKKMTNHAINVMNDAGHTTSWMTATLFQNNKESKIFWYCSINTKASEAVQKALSEQNLLCSTILEEGGKIYE